MLVTSRSDQTNVLPSVQEAPAKDEWAGFLPMSEVGFELPPARDGYRWETIQKLHPNGNMLFSFQEVPDVPNKITATQLLPG